MPRRWPSGVGYIARTTTPGTEPAERGAYSGKERTAHVAEKSPGPSGLKEARTEHPGFAKVVNMMTEVIADDEEILVTDEVEIEVAADTGA